uniref:F-box domain-containing protein n=1 Tax=Panagrellus redivivus TaxID=6233 RepID=A0A7E4UQX8_PANRE
MIPPELVARILRINILRIGTASPSCNVRIKLGRSLLSPTGSKRPTSKGEAVDSRHRHMRRRMNSKLRLDGSSLTVGVIPTNGSVDIAVIVPPADQWHRDPNDFAGRRIRIVAENLLLPLSMKDVPESQTRSNTLGRKLFHTTATQAPLTRVYTKFNLLLPKIPEDWAMIVVNSAGGNKSS